LWSALAVIITGAFMEISRNSLNVSSSVRVAVAAGLAGLLAFALERLFRPKDAASSKED